MFGCVILEVLTGTGPFHWLSSVEEVIFQRVGQPRVSPLDAAAACDRLISLTVSPSPRVTSLLELAAACFTYVPADRPDARGVLERLQHIQQSASLAPVVYDGDLAAAAAGGAVEVRSLNKC